MMENPQNRISAVGIGSAAARLIDRLPSRAPREVRCLAIDSDRRILETLSVESFALGRSNRAPLGSGGDPRRGREWAAQAVQAFLQEIDPSTALLGAVFLGGGTGSGAAPVLLGEACRRGMFTAAVAVVPLEAEGPRRGEITAVALDELRRSIDVVVRVNTGDLLGALPEDISVEQAFEKVYASLSVALAVLVGVIAGRCVINVSPADLAGGGGGQLGHATLTVAYCGSDRDLLGNDQRGGLPGIGRIAPKRGLLLLLCGRQTPMHRMHTVVECVRGLLPGVEDLKVGAAVDRTRKGGLEALLLVSETSSGKPLTSRAVTGTARRGGPRGRPVQGEFTFEGAHRGRFKGVQPTIHAGRDLDIPTFIRRGIRLRGRPPG